MKNNILIPHKTRRILKEIDIFGAPVPGFNLNGKQSINTHTGGCISIIIISIVLIFGTNKL